MQRVASAVWHHARADDLVGERQPGLCPEVLASVRLDALPHGIECVHALMMASTPAGARALASRLPELRGRGSSNFFALAGAPPYRSWCTSEASAAALTVLSQGRSTAHSCAAVPRQMASGRVR